MNKYLLVDKPTGLVLALSVSIPVVFALRAGFSDSKVITISKRHPFYSLANRTMMSGKQFVVDNKNLVEESQERFPAEVLEMRDLAQARRPVLSRLLQMISGWVMKGNPLLFTSMETIVEIALRDCDHSEGKYTRYVREYATMMGMQDEYAYEHLDQMAASVQERKIRGLGFMHKFIRMINESDIESIKRVNALMYSEWHAFLKEDPVVDGDLGDTEEFEDQPEEELFRNEGD
jgi:hypothetical protein